MKIVFLLEERSMKNVLDVLLPKLLPNEFEFICVPHSGKSDLQRSIPRKLKGWTEPGVRFVILHDKDANDCMQLKRDLVALASQNGRPDTLVRIVCYELESWFLGDLAAVAAAYPRYGSIMQLQQKSKYRNPDALANASQELMKLVPEYQRIAGSQRIAAHMSIKKNAFVSFQTFISGLHRVAYGER